MAQAMDNETHAAKKADENTYWLISNGTGHKMHNRTVMMVPANRLNFNAFNSSTCSSSGVGSEGWIDTLSAPCLSVNFFIEWHCLVFVLIGTRKFDANCSTDVTLDVIGQRVLFCPCLSVEILFDFVSLCLLRPVRVTSQSKFDGEMRLPMTEMRAPVPSDVKLPTSSGTLLPVVFIVSSPNIDLAVINHTLNPHTNPRTAPAITGFGDAFFHVIVNVIGTTAGPMTTPIKR
jgi:hypothetical protein